MNFTTTNRNSFHRCKLKVGEVPVKISIWPQRHCTIVTLCIRRLLLAEPFTQRNRLQGWGLFSFSYFFLPHSCQIVLRRTRCPISCHYGEIIFFNPLFHVNMQQTVTQVSGQYALWRSASRALCCVCFNKKRNRQIRASVCPWGGREKKISLWLVWTCFFPPSLTGVCACAWECVWEIEKASFSLTGNYWLGLELRNKISHGNQSHFGLCHIFHSAQLFPPLHLYSGFHSVKQTDPQGGGGGEKKKKKKKKRLHTDIELPQWIIASLLFFSFFSKTRPIIKKRGLST